MSKVSLFQHVINIKIIGIFCAFGLQKPMYILCLKHTLIWGSQIWSVQQSQIATILDSIGLGGKTCMAS